MTAGSEHGPLPDSADGAPPVPGAPPPPAGDPQPRAPRAEPDDGPAPHPRRRRAVWFAAAGILVLAAAVAGAIAWAWHTRSGVAASPAPEATAGLANRAYERGHCYVWDQDSASATPVDVACTQPHLYEAVANGDVSLSAEFPRGGAFPTADAWTSVTTRYCRPLAETYLGRPIDPYGRLRVVGLHPTAQAWGGGDRRLRCGLETSVPSVTHVPGRSDLVTGSARDLADQALLYPVDGCLDDTGGTGRVVGCASPHDAVAIGDARLADAAAPPDDDAFRAQAGDLCARVLRDRFGTALRTDDTTRLGWFRVRPESWSAGTRSFSCLLLYRTANDRARMVIGDVRNAHVA